MKYRVVFDRGGCIGAAACAAVAPEFWQMVDDGKAILIGATSKEEGRIQELILTKEQLGDKLLEAVEKNKEAAEVCPVQVIHVYEILPDGSEKKLI